jgi:hypothetical protein
MTAGRAQVRGETDGNILAKGSGRQDLGRSAVIHRRHDRNALDRWKEHLVGDTDAATPVGPALP